MRTTIHWFKRRGTLEIPCSVEATIQLTVIPTQLTEARIDLIYNNNCAHMHCDVDLRSRRMWAASYRLTRLIMNEDSHVPRGPDTGRERVLTQRRGNGDDGAVG